MMPKRLDIEVLVDKARKHNSDSDALKLCWQLADALENYATALERQQAVAAAAREWEKQYSGQVVEGNPSLRLCEALAALDAPPEGGKP